MIVSFKPVATSAHRARFAQAHAVGAVPADLARGRAAGQAATVPGIPGLAKGLPSRIHLWRGTSGRRHLCTVYSLLDCPQLNASVCLLVRREADGRRDIVAVRVVDTAHGSLNLAEIRRSGATAGANEVHVSFLPANAQQRAHLVRELSGAAAIHATRLHA